MPGIATADAFVLRRIGATTGVTGDGIFHALDVLEHPLDAPETTAGEYGGFATGLGGFVEGRWR
ncbi:hypothetical protein D3C86_2228960 [compost metagenome]